MGAKRKLDPADTYVFDEDVMDEMENVEATVELPELSCDVEDILNQEDDFLENADETTVVLPDGYYKD